MPKIYKTMRIVICLLLCFSISRATLQYLFPNLSKLSGQLLYSLIPRTVVNICIYSNDPDKYQPRCFTCLEDAYPNIIQACADSGDNPDNVTYTQASCIDKNCAINNQRTVNPITIRTGRKISENGNKVFKNMMSVLENLKGCSYRLEKLNSTEAQVLDPENPVTHCKIIFALKDK